MSLTAIFVLLLAALALLLILQQWNRERYEVLNRGVNQSPVVTLLRALGHVVGRLLSYGMLLYLLAALFFFVRFRHDCRADPRLAPAYDRTTAFDHAGEALAWPLYQDQLPCEQ